MKAVMKSIFFRRVVSALAIVWLAACGGGGGGSGASGNTAGTAGTAGLLADGGSGTAGSVSGMSDAGSGAGGSPAPQAGQGGNQGGKGAVADGGGTGVAGADGGMAGPRETTNPGGPATPSGLDGNGTPAASGPEVRSAAFMPPVSGLSYLFGELGLTTGEKGDFRYVTVDGVSAGVAFAVGGISLGTVVPHACLSPLSLIHGADAQFDLDNRIPDTAVAVMRFLMTLDDDNNPTNGIQIGIDTHFALYRMDPAASANLQLDPSSPEFGAESNLSALIALLSQAAGSNRYVLASSENASEVLGRQLSTCHPLSYEGLYTTHWVDPNSNIGQPALELDPDPQPFSITLNGKTFTGTLVYQGKTYKVAGLVDLLGHLSVEEMIDSQENKIFANGGVMYFEGKIDFRTRTLDLKRYVRQSTTG